MLNNQPRKRCPEFTLPRFFQTHAIAHLPTAVYLEGAGFDGGLHVMAAYRKCDFGSMLDFIQLERSIAIPGRQERLPELANGVYALHPGLFGGKTTASGA